uniref:hypothetical protein n=1 Tax=Salmonella sp. s55044 TaxID=3159677 RepID=UPI00397FC4B6
MNHDSTKRKQTLHQRGISEGHYQNTDVRGGPQINQSSRERFGHAVERQSGGDLFNQSFNERDKVEEDFTRDDNFQQMSFELDDKPLILTPN